MAKQSIDIPLDGVGEAHSASTRRQRAHSRIDIPLDGEAACGAPDITDAELAFVNRHHEEYLQMRRRAREQEAR